MFQINRREYGAMVEACKEIEAIFEEEQEFLSEQTQQTAQTMDGIAISTWCTGFNSVLNNGVYEDALEQMKSLRTSMETMQPLVNRIVAEGILLADQLDADEMIFPYAGEVSGEELILLNDVYVGAVRNSCWQIWETGKSMGTIMEEVMEDCSGIVELGEERQQLAKACKAADRIETFREAFDKYVYDVHDLDESLRLDFQSMTNALLEMSGVIMETTLCEINNRLQIQELQTMLNKDPMDWTMEENRIASELWVNAVEEGDTETLKQLLDMCRDGEGGRLDSTRLGILRDYTEGESREFLSVLMEDSLPEWAYAEYLIDVKKEEGILTITITQDVLLEEDNSYTVVSDGKGGAYRSIVNIFNYTPDYPEDYYETAAGYMEKDEEGIYAFESVLKQDATGFSEREKEILSLLYQDKCRIVETSSCREERAEQYDITERFIEGMFRHEQKREEKMTVHCLYLDEEWACSMESYIEDEQCLAYQMLSELSVYRQEKGPGWIEVTEESPIVDVMIDPKRMGVVLELEFMKTAVMENPLAESVYIGNRTRARQYVDNLDEKTIDNLYELGYTKEEIAVMLCMAESVKDEDFLEELIKQNYTQAFRTNPDDLSGGAGCFLTAYLMNFLQFADENGTCKEMEDVLNDMLGQKNSAKSYLELLAVGSSIYLAGAELYVSDLCSQVLKEGNGKYVYDMDILESPEEQLRAIVAFHVLTKGLYLTYLEGDLYDGVLSEWDYHMQEYQGRLDGLSINGSQNFSVQLQLYDSKTGETQKSTELETDIIWRSINTLSERNMERLEALEKKIETELLKGTIDIVISVAGLAFPRTMGAVQAGVDTVWGVSQGKASSALKGITNKELLGKGMSQGQKGAVGVGITVMAYLEKGQSLSDEKDKIIRDQMVKWFYSGESYRINGESVYLGESICNYNVIEGIAEWNQYGCGVFLQEVLPWKGSVDDINKEISDRVNNEHKDLSSEEKEAIEFLIYGNSRKGENKQTVYSSILEIEGEVFLKYVDTLSELIKQDLSNDHSIETAWLKYIEEKGEKK